MKNIFIKKNAFVAFTVMLFITVNLKALTDQQLLDYIYQKPPLSAGNLKNILIQNSPLSDTVLIAAIYRNPALPTGSLKEVLLATPHLSDKVLLAMLNIKPQLPGGIIENILTANTPLSDAVLIAVIKMNPALPSGNLSNILLNESPLSVDVLTALGTISASLPKGMINTIVQSNPLKVSAVAKHISCNGGNNGSIKLNVSGGIPPYTYKWSNGATTDSIYNLTAGTYNATVTDKDGRTATASATLTQPAVAVTVSISKGDVKCYGGNDGFAKVTAAGGISPYTYLWSNGVTVNSQSNIQAGNYFVTITDANGCIKTALASVLQPDSLAVSVITSDAGCNGSNTGTANATATGGVPPYNFLWSNGSTTAALNNLSAGSFPVFVTDANQCNATASANVNAKISPVADAGNSIGICSGKSVTLGGFSYGTVSYAWSPVQGLSNPASSNPAASPATTTNYTLTVTSADGCTATDQVTVTVSDISHQKFGQQWVQRYSGADSISNFAIKVDAHKCVYVLGATRTGYSGDIVLLKYSPEGTLIWSIIYDSPNHNIDYAIDMVIDDNCNSYIAGSTYDPVIQDSKTVTMKIDSNGNKLWEDIYVYPGSISSHPRSIAKAGNEIVITGYSQMSLYESEVLVIKYGENGNRIWEKVYGNVNKYQYGEIVTSDSLGNIYISGSVSDINFSYRNIQLLKYDFNGNLLWENQYTNSGSTSDFVRDLAIDSWGNLYLAGSIYQSGVNRMALIKYSSTGKLEWTKLNAATTDFALATSVLLDQNFIYTSGVFYQNGTVYNTLIKYDTLANTIWDYTSIAPAEEYKASHLITKDASGNIVIAGIANGPDYFTSGIDPDNGKLVWEMIYDGPAHSYDILTSISTDNDNNIYVTGFSYDNSPGSTKGGNELISIATVKYGLMNIEGVNINVTPDSLICAGQTATLSVDSGFASYYWSNGSASPSIQVGKEGQYIVTVSNGKGCAASDTVQVNLFRAKAGNDTVLYAGQSTRIGSSPYTEPGVLYQWTPTDYLDDPTIANPIASPPVTTEYTLVVTRGVCSDTDKIVLIIDTLPPPPPLNDSALWVQKYLGPDSMGGGAFTIDIHKHIYVAGMSFDSMGSLHPTIIKYDSLGNQLWAVTHKDTIPHFSIISSLITDKQCNVYLSGYASGNGFLIKYNGAGVLQWVQNLGGLYYARGAAGDSLGNIYSTGYLYDSNNHRRLAVVKTNSSGQIVWTRMQNTTYDGYGMDIKMDLFGNIVAVGIGRSNNTDEGYIHTLKYDAAGNELWSQTHFASVTNAKNFIAELTRTCHLQLTATGDALVTVSTNSKSGADVLLLKYDAASGNEIWNTIYGSFNDNNDYIGGIYTDTSNRTYLAITSEPLSAASAQQSTDIVVLALNDQGNELWKNSFDGGQGNLADEAYAVTADPEGNIYVCGSSASIGGKQDYITLKYNSAGQFQYKKRHNGIGNNLDVALALKAYNNNEVYVTGLSIDDNNLYNFITIRYGNITSVPTPNPLPQANYQPLFDDKTFDRQLNTSLPVGTIAGEASVTLTGAATYTIPIYAPPGTAGMQPSLSLVYNSQMPPGGQLGTGWSLGGLSVITRANKTIYHDGTVGPVKLEASSPYALDGNRLIALQGANGADGTIYGTEAETFAQIISHTESGIIGGPAWFEVKTKEGLTLEYGHDPNKTNNSQFLSEDGKKVVFWRLSKTYDNYGNYIEYRYKNDDRESIIDEVIYSGNDNAGIIPYNSIKFKYTASNNINSLFIDGTEIRQENLIEEIEVRCEGNTMKKYFLTYGFDKFNSFLSDIVEEGTNGERYNSTRFKYSNDNYAIDSKVENLLNQNAEYRIGDYNGDGLSDLAIFTFNPIPGSGEITKDFQTWSVLINQFGTSFKPVVSNAPLPSDFFPFNPLNPSTSSLHFNAGIESFDLNGDGMDDLLMGTKQGQYYSYIPYISTGAGFTPQNTVFNLTSEDGHMFAAGDFNGDKILGAFAVDKEVGTGMWYLHFFGPTPATYSGSIIKKMNGSTDLLTYLGFVSNNFNNLPPSQTFFYPIDFDGDGKTELLTTNSSGNTIILRLSAVGNTMELVEVYNSSNFPVLFLPDNKIYVADFNGDGISDILESSNNAWRVGYGTGSAYKVYNKSSMPSLSSLHIPSGNDAVTMVGDFNADGKSDILQSLKLASTNPIYKTNLIYAVFSTGKGFHTSSLIDNSNVFFTDEPIHFLGDFNGDGNNDVLLVNNTVEIISSFPQPEFKYDLGKTIEIKKMGTKGPPFLLTNILNGINHKTTLTYAPLVSGFYLKGSGASYPVNDFQGALYVATSITVPNGTGFKGAVSNITYHYEGAKIHKQGKGFIGFSKIISFEHPLKIRTTTEFDFDNNHYISLLKKKKTILDSDLTPISEVIYTNNITPLNNSKRFFTSVTGQTTTDHLSGFTNTASFSYDNNGNLTQQTLQAGSVETETTQYNGWLAKGSPVPNRPSSVTVTRTRTGEIPFSLTTGYTWESTGKLKTQIDFSGLPKAVTTTNVYDNSTGNLLETMLSTNSGNLAPRTNKFQYDPAGRFVIQSTNAKNQTASATFDSRWGEPLSVTGINGLTTVYKYDSFGRPVKVTTPDGLHTDYSLNWEQGMVSDASGQTLPALFYASIAPQGAPAAKTWKDIYGRTVKTEMEGMTQPVFSTQQYNNKGQLISRSAPYYNGETPVFTSFSYDDFGRLLTQGSSDGNDNLITSYAYSKASGLFVTTITDPAGQNHTRRTDAAGRVSIASDNGGTILYNYHSNGQVRRIVTGGTVSAQTEFDEYGRQKKLTDANAGVTTYEYDAYGQLFSQTDANGRLYTDIKYDVLGNVLSKTGPEGTYTWQYVNSGAAINAPVSIISPKGNSADGVLEAYSYDGLGRTISKIESVFGKVLNTQYAYDPFGNLSNITYPSGYKIHKTYDSKGYLVNVGNGITSQGILSVQEMNAQSQYTKYLLDGTTVNKGYDKFGFVESISATGNQTVQNHSYNWNKYTGNLMQRTDHTKNLYETFTYDNLNRLTTSAVQSIGGGLSPAPVALSYAPNGNIESKTGPGSYGYATFHPNGVLEVTNDGNAVSLTPQDITYTPFNQPEKITEGDYELSFKYGTDRQRRKAELKNKGNLVKSILYAGNYEEITVGADVYKVHYITCATGLAAVNVRKNNGPDDIYYVYTDHLGSLVTLTDANGTVVYEQNFDAWGQKRNPQNWTYTANATTAPVWLIRGFTGHEHLDEFALINMNGRVYDPVLGRFNSPDNFVQNPYSTQNYNRYSYALNNPLKYTDPSGEIVFTLATLIAAPFTGGASLALLPYAIGADIGMWQGGSIANGTMNPFQWDYSSGRTWGYMAGGAVVGAASAGAANAVATSGMVGANTAAIMAGSFTNSVGMHIVSGGRTDVSVGFGFGSYNFSTGEFGYLGKRGNSALENIGYGLGALANVADILAGFNPGSVELRTENTGTPGDKDLIGHSQIVDANGNPIVDWGPGEQLYKDDPFRSVPGTNSYEQGVALSTDKMKWDPVTIKGVNTGRLSNWSPAGKYNLACNSCVTQASRALNASGAFNIGGHPYLLHGQMYLRSIGVRPMMYSHYMYQY